MTETLPTDYEGMQKHLRQLRLSGDSRVKKCECGDYKVGNAMCRCDDFVLDADGRLTTPKRKLG